MLFQQYSSKLWKLLTASTERETIKSMKTSTASRNFLHSFLALHLILKNSGSPYMLQEHKSWQDGISRMESQGLADQPWTERTDFWLGDLALCTCLALGKCSSPTWRGQKHYQTTHNTSQLHSGKQTTFLILLQNCNFMCLFKQIWAQFSVAIS